MSTETRIGRHHVNWRAAVIREKHSRPIYGHASEASESSIIIQLPDALPVGLVCRVYLDIPAPDSGRPDYVDFRVKIMETSLIGQVSEFRHICKITDIQTQQLAFMKKTLAHH